MSDRYSELLPHTHKLASQSSSPTHDHSCFTYTPTTPRLFTQHQAV